MNDARNTSGQAYALTVLTPIREGCESSLAYYLDGFESGTASPLAGVPGTHFARWALIGDVVYEGGRQKRDHLKVGRLLFTSNFDGTIERYLEALRTGLGEVADRIWGQCSGYPGSVDPAAFAGYFRAHQVESALFFAAYGDLTVDQVKRNLATRRKVIEFALSAQGMTPDGLQAAFRETFAR